jgi:hypothetical protein
MKKRLMMKYAGRKFLFPRNPRQTDIMRRAIKKLLKRNLKWV